VNKPKIRLKKIHFSCGVSNTYNISSDLFEAEGYFFYIFPDFYNPSTCIRVSGSGFWEYGLADDCCCPVRNCIYDKNILAKSQEFFQQIEKRIKFRNN